MYNSTTLLEGGTNGGKFYWYWNIFRYQNPSNCQYTLNVNPRENNGEYAEIALHETWECSDDSVAMDVRIHYSLPINIQEFYASATLSHPPSYPKYLTRE